MQDALYAKEQERIQDPRKCRVERRNGCVVLSIGDCIETDLALKVSKVDDG